MSDEGHAEVSVLALPAPVLALCLGGLEEPSDLARACCVCRAFNEAGSSSDLWRTFCGRWLHWGDDLHALLKMEQDFKAMYALKIQDVIRSDLGDSGSMSIGRQYWASYAAVNYNVADCAQQLGALLQHQEPDLLRGALIIANALDVNAEREIAAVRGRVLLLATELRRRMDAAAAGDNLEGLALLKQLLFGRRSGLFHPEDALPPAREGLQLRGNRDDQFAEDNLLLHKVFETRRGNPTSLSVIAVAVGQAAGLSMFHVGVPGHCMAKLAPSGTSPVHYLDVFNGIMMGRQGVERLCAHLLVGEPPDLLDAPTPAAKVLERMCLDLLKIMEHNEALPSTERTILELLCAIEPDSHIWRMRLAQLYLMTRDPDACYAEVQKMQHNEHGQGFPEMGAQLAAQVDAQIRKLSERAQSEKQRLLDEGATRHKRSQFPSVRYRVGDVVRHKRTYYKGLIYSWDATCKAPDDWSYATNMDLCPGGRNQPFYHIMLDEPRQPRASTYEAQENIEVITRADGESDSSFFLQSTRIGEHFDGIEPGGSRYKPNAYLRMRYPEDADIGHALGGLHIDAC